MIEDECFEDEQAFCAWFKDINPNDEMDTVEAVSIYFELEMYETLGVI